MPREKRDAGLINIDEDGIDKDLPWPGRCRLAAVKPDDVRDRVQLGIVSISCDVLVFLSVYSTPCCRLA